MASYDMKASLGMGGWLQDKNRDSLNGNQNLNPANVTSYTQNSRIDTGLISLLGSYYTQQILDSMNLNDKLYAFRILLDSGAFL